MATPVVDQDACVGCGTCESICPECFEIREDGKSWVICNSCEEAGCNCEEAAESCPVNAITIE